MYLPLPSLITFTFDSAFMLSTQVYVVTHVPIKGSLGTVIVIYKGSPALSLSFIRVATWTRGRDINVVLRVQLIRNSVTADK